MTQQRKSTGDREANNRPPVGNHLDEFYRIAEHVPRVAERILFSLPRMSAHARWKEITTLDTEWPFFRINFIGMVLVPDHDVLVTRRQEIEFTIALTMTAIDCGGILPIDSLDLEV